jgi:hypothetical protein
MKPEQLDVMLFWVLMVCLLGIAVALLWLTAAKLARNSARGAAMLAGVSSLLYVGVGVAGAAIRAERPAPAPEASKAAAEGEATPADPNDAPAAGSPVDPAVAQAQQALEAAVAGGDWEAAAQAHAALEALEAAHPALAPAWAKIEAGRAAPKGDGGDGVAADVVHDAGGAGDVGGPTPAGDDGAVGGDAAGAQPSPVVEPEPVKKPRPKPKKKKRPAGDGADDGGASAPEPDDEG